MKNKNGLVTLFSISMLFAAGCDSVESRYTAGLESLEKNQEACGIDPEGLRQAKEAERTYLIERFKDAVAVETQLYDAMKAPLRISLDFVYGADMAACELSSDALKFNPGALGFKTVLARALQRAPLDGRLLPRLDQIRVRLSPLTGNALLELNREAEVQIEKILVPATTVQGSELAEGLTGTYERPARTVERRVLTVFVNAGDTSVGPLSVDQLIGKIFE